MKIKKHLRLVQKILFQMLQLLVDGIIRLNFYFKENIKDKQGETYLDQHHFIRYVGDDGCDNKFCWKHYLIKVEYLEDGFADIKYFEASERLHINFHK